jgi:hypothetical protein
MTLPVPIREKYLALATMVQNIQALDERIDQFLMREFEQCHDKNFRELLVTMHDNVEGFCESLTNLDGQTIHEMGPLPVTSIGPFISEVPATTIGPFISEEPIELANFAQTFAQQLAQQLGKDEQQPQQQAQPVMQQPLPAFESLAQIQSLAQAAAQHVVSIVQMQQQHQQLASGLHDFPEGSIAFAIQMQPPQDSVNASSGDLSVKGGEDTSSTTSDTTG